MAHKGQPALPGLPPDGFSHCGFNQRNNLFASESDPDSFPSNVPEASGDQRPIPAPSSSLSTLGVASSVFITLTPPRRDVAVAQEVRRAACEARPGRPRDPSAPTKAPGPSLAGKPDPWIPLGRAVAAAPAVALQLSNGGCPPPPALGSEDSLPDLDLLPPPPPPPPAYLPPAEEEPLGPTGASLLADLEQLPPPPPQSLAEGLPPQPQPGHLRPVEEELPPPPEEPVGGPEKDASPGVCGFCHKTVSPRELAVEAMKRQYHAQCFTCRICRRQLAGQSFYQKDGRPLCEPCYQDTLEKCGRCAEVVREHIIRALGQAFHPSCFTCVSCARCIGDESFALDSQNEVYCLDDFYRKFAPVCSICENPIIPRDGKDAFKIECMGRNFHENCYRCEDCRILLSIEPTDQGCYPLNNRLFCKPCHVKRSAAGCC
ncbi:filamin-binding LIM protein 1 [Echinops telfairi]|uniref:Filamin-binding LIM protein 1 n=1 Tax=Echinops telfairi TaxID=9371 RepID=A0ABM0ZR17_ECHTE|nr:filamin-binding LIM protein 1 [Echinops telfairi]